MDSYPETQAVTYAQWFTYVYALWEEQFRGGSVAYVMRQAYLVIICAIRAESL